MRRNLDELSHTQIQNMQDSVLDMQNSTTDSQTLDERQTISRFHCSQEISRRLDEKQIFSVYDKIEREIDDDKYWDMKTDTCQWSFQNEVRGLCNKQIHIMFRVENDIILFELIRQRIVKWNSILIEYWSRLFQFKQQWESVLFQQSEKLETIHIHWIEMSVKSSMRKRCEVMNMLRNITTNTRIYSITHNQKAPFRCFLSVWSFCEASTSKICEELLIDSVSESYHRIAFAIARNQFKFLCISFFKQHICDFSFESIIVSSVQQCCVFCDWWNLASRNHLCSINFHNVVASRCVRNNSQECVFCEYRRFVVNIQFKSSICINPKHRWNFLRVI